MNDECGQRTYANTGSQQILQCFPWQIEQKSGENFGSHARTLSSSNLGTDTILACKRCEDCENWRSTFPFSKEWNIMKQAWLWFLPQTNDFAQAHRYPWLRPDLARRQSHFPWCGRSDQCGTNQSVYATWLTPSAVSPSAKVQSPILPVDSQGFMI